LLCCLLLRCLVGRHGRSVVFEWHACIAAPVFFCSEKGCAQKSGRLSLTFSHHSKWLVLKLTLISTYTWMTSHECRIYSQPSITRNWTLARWTRWWYVTNSTLSFRRRLLALAHLVISLYSLVGVSSRKWHQQELRSYWKLTVSKKGKRTLGNTVVDLKNGFSGQKGWNAQGYQRLRHEWCMTVRILCLDSLTGSNVASYPTTLSSNCKVYLSSTVRIILYTKGRKERYFAISDYEKLYVHELYFSGWTLLQERLKYVLNGANVQDTSWWWQLAFCVRSSSIRRINRTYSQNCHRLTDFCSSAFLKEKAESLESVKSLLMNCLLMNNHLTKFLKPIQ
jgi:hypothetical protein